jgi:putative endonuclease
VYILASGRHGTLYIGMTSDLPGRLYQHRENVTKGFTARYAVHRLVYFEMHGEMDAAITREKRLKAWRRDWKIALIERENPHWEDLATGLGFEPLLSHRKPHRHPDESQGP